MLLDIAFYVACAVEGWLQDSVNFYNDKTSKSDGLSNTLVYGMAT